MRIAQVAPLMESCPPRLYGGTERVVSFLTEELVRLAKTTGFTRLIARIQWHGMDQRIILRTIELLATKVRPLVEKALR